MNKAALIREHNILQGNKKTILFSTKKSKETDYISFCIMQVKTVHFIKLTEGPNVVVVYYFVFLLLSQGKVNFSKKKM